VDAGGRRVQGDLTKGEEMSMRSTSRHARAGTVVVAVRRPVIAGALMFSLAGVLLAPPAQAHHGNGTARCNKAYGGTFHHFTPTYPIYARSSGRKLGWLSLNWQALGGGKYRTCAVVMRQHHGLKRFSGVRIKPVYANRPWRRKTTRSRWGAGPVVYRGRCVKIRGTISKSSRFRAFCYR
jgi:hypothetical protein